MQPFEVTQPNPQAQAKPLDPAPQQGQNPQLQGQYPQSQQTGYPTLPQRPSQQPYPQNYQAPFPSQAYQQPGGYPNYQAQPQPQYVMYNQGVNQAQDAVQKRMLAQQLSRNVNASGKGLVVIFSLLMFAGGLMMAGSYATQDKYKIMNSAYKAIGGRDYNMADTFSPDTCQAFLGGMIGVPYFLVVFAIFNFLAMCVSFTGATCCMCLQVFSALIWAGIAFFTSQQKCVGYSVLTTLFGANNIPQNAWNYYAGMAVASLIACCLNYSWSSNQDKAKRDQRNLALMMAAS